MKCIEKVYAITSGGNSQPLVSKEKSFKMSHTKTGLSFNKRKKIFNVFDDIVESRHIKHEYNITRAKTNAYTIIHGCIVYNYMCVSMCVYKYFFLFI